MTAAPFSIRCWFCLSEYDPVASSWCRHAEPTKICPYCYRCFCDASAEYKDNFWKICPEEMLKEKLFFEVSAHVPLGEMLVKAGRISEENLQTALQKQRIFKKKIGEILIMMALISADELELYLLSQKSIETVDLKSTPFDEKLIRRLGREKCRELQIVPLEAQKIGNNQVLRFALHDTKDLQRIKLHPDFSALTLIPYLAREEDVRAFLDKTDAAENDVSIAPPANGNLHVELINQIIKKAIMAEYSDIYFERKGDQINIHYQGNERLIKVNLPVMDIREFFAKLKKICDISSDDQTGYQKSTLKISRQLSHIHIRAFYLPSHQQENLRLKIINTNLLQRPLTEFNWDDQELESIVSRLAAPRGLYLIAGQNSVRLQETAYCLMHSLKNERIASVESIVLANTPGVYKIEKEEPDVLEDAYRMLLQYNPQTMVLFDFFEKHYAPAFLQFAEQGKLILLIKAFSNEEIADKLLRELEIPFAYIKKHLQLLVLQREMNVLCDQCKIKDAKTVTDYFPESGFGQEFQLFSEKGCEFCSQTGSDQQRFLSEVFVLNDTDREAFRETDLIGISQRISESGNLTFARKAMNYLLKGEISYREYLRFI